MKRQFIAENKAKTMHRENEKIKGKRKEKAQLQKDIKALQKQKEMLAKQVSLAQTIEANADVVQRSVAGNRKASRKVVAQFKETSTVKLPSPTSMRAALVGCGCPVEDLSYFQQAAVFSGRLFTQLDHTEKKKYSKTLEFEYQNFLKYELELYKDGVISDKMFEDSKKRLKKTCFNAQNISRAQDELMHGQWNMTVQAAIKKLTPDAVDTVVSRGCVQLYNHRFSTRMNQLLDGKLSTRQFNIPYHKLVSLLFNTLPEERKSHPEDALFLNFAQDGMRGHYAKSMNIMTVCFKDKDLIGPLFGETFNHEDPFRNYHSVEAIFSIAVANYGDNAEETKLLAQDFFAEAQKYSGDDAELFWVEKWQGYYKVSSPTTLDKKAAWGACGVGGGPDAEYCDHATNHKSRDRGMKQAYICPWCKRRHRSEACSHVWVPTVYIIDIYCILIHIVYTRIS